MLANLRIMMLSHVKYFISVALTCWAASVESVTCCRSSAISIFSFAIVFERSAVCKIFLAIFKRSNITWKLRNNIMYKSLLNPNKIINNQTCFLWSLHSFGTGHRISVCVPESLTADSFNDGICCSENSKVSSSRMELTSTVLLEMADGANESFEQSEVEATVDSRRENNWAIISCCWPVKSLNAMESLVCCFKAASRRSISRHFPCSSPSNFDSLIW